MTTPYVNAQQYPAVRAMLTCLSCGGTKHTGLLVCWECHNRLKMTHDVGYGAVDDVIAQAQKVADDAAGLSQTCDPAE